MSPHAANSLVHDLVQMAKAMERVPLLERENRDLNDMVESYAKAIQRLELKLIDRNSEIDNLQANIRSLEVSRDDAELRFLEADDRTMRALDFIKATFGNAGALIQALEPPKAQPEPMTEAPMYAPGDAPTFTGDASNQDSIVVAVPEGQHDEGSEGQSAAPSSAYASDGTVSPGEGVSVQADPTATATNTASETASTLNAESTKPVATTMDGDPEPTDRWSNEWWAWKDRQGEALRKAAE